MAVAQYKVSCGLVPLESTPIISKLFGEPNNLLIADAKEKYMEAKMVVADRGFEVTVDKSREPSTGPDGGGDKIAELALAIIKILAVIHALESTGDELSELNTTKTPAELLRAFGNWVT